MKRIFFILLVFVTCIQPSTHAGIIGATWWVKDNKTVCIYFDDHDAGTDEQNREHFDCIRRTIIEKTEIRTQPLLILVENYMRDPAYRDLVRQLEVHFKGQHRFLQQFNDWVDRHLPNSIFIKSFDARVVPILTYSLFCEWIRRLKGQPEFPEQLYTQLDAAFNRLTFGDVFRLADKIDDYIRQAPAESGLAFILLEQKQVMKDLISGAIDILNDGFSMEDIDRKSIKDIIRDLFSPVSKPYTENQAQIRAWSSFFEDYEGGDFWQRVHLWQLTNANMLWETLTFQGNIAIFTGSYHAVAMEECLKILGYVQSGIEVEKQVEMERCAFEGDLDPKEADLIPLRAYAWMQ